MQQSFLDPTTLRAVDSVPLAGTTPAWLDRTRVYDHMQNARANGYEVPTDVEAYLYHKRCLVTYEDDAYVTLAGLLCFGYDPQALFPRAVVDIGHYRGMQTLSHDVVHLEKDIGGTVFDQLARVETYLWTNTHHGMTLSEEQLQRVPVHEYPRAVIRELIVNMLAHRDYTNVQSVARVQKFRDRIEWVSPGSLPPGITVDNILAEQASRNPVLLSILYEAGYGEGVGQGLDTVVATLHQEGLKPPQFYDTGASFIVTVAGRPQEQFAGDGGYARLNTRQQELLTYLRDHGPLTRKQLAQIFQETDRTLQRDLRAMQDANLIESSGKHGRSVLYSVRDPM